MSRKIKQYYVSCFYVLKRERQDNFPGNFMRRNDILWCASFEYIHIYYGPTSIIIMFNSFSAEIDFRRQNLTSIRPLKSVPALKGLHPHDGSKYYHFTSLKTFRT